MAWSRLGSESRFHAARRRAFLAALLDTIRHRPSNLLALEEVRKRLNVRGQRALGHQIVPVAHIIGSEGRYSDFDRRFLPRSAALEDRWTNIDRAIARSVELPPVELYKLGDLYFVRDGNHRVSVARQLGQAYIDAYVTELLVDVPLAPDLSVRDLLLAEEYNDFLEWTNLHRLRPEQRIVFSELGGYLDLVQDINAHRYFLGQELGRAIGRDEAVAHWYDHVYQPIVQAIRAQGVLRQFPGRTEADLYRWIMDHRWFVRERTGVDPGPEQATRDYTMRFGRKRRGDALAARLWKALRRLRPWM
jgi:hypothetical protein